MPLCRSEEQDRLLCLCAACSRQRGVLPSAAARASSAARGEAAARADQPGSRWGIGGVSF